MSEKVFLFDSESEVMNNAYINAQNTFKYFYRELSWEKRRIIPGLDMAMIKIAFTDGPRSDGNPEYEHMWVNEVDYDGEKLTGFLMNEPNWLSSVKQGDTVSVSLDKMSDWMYVVNGVVYGGHTVNAMRSQMSKKEREEHDNAWGLNFGNPNEVRIEIDRKKDEQKKSIWNVFSKKVQSDIVTEEQDEHKEHPMCLNMLEKIEAQLKQDPCISNTIDKNGLSILHSESIAGNFGVVKLLVKYGADIELKTPAGKKSEDLAREMGWSHIAEFLSVEAKKKSGE